MYVSWMCQYVIQHIANPYYCPPLFVGKSHENGYTAECVTPRSFMLILSVRTTPSYLFDLPHSLSLSALMTVGSLIL